MRRTQVSNNLLLGIYRCFLKAQQQTCISLIYRIISIIKELNLTHLLVVSPDAAGTSLNNLVFSEDIEIRFLSGTI